MKMPLKIKTFFTKSKLFKRFEKKTWWGLALVLILAVGGGVTYFQMNMVESQTTETETLQTTIARKSDLVIYASGTGTLISMDEVDLGFKTSGQVLQINVAVGDEVSTGDVLAVIDDSGVQVQYTQAKRNLLELTSMFYVLQDLNESDTAAQKEIDGLVSQIQETLTDGQTQAIEAMSLSRQDMFAITQGNSANTNTTEESTTGGGMGGPPEMGGGGMPGGGMPGGGMSTTGTTTASDDTSARPAMDTSTPTALFDAIIKILEKKVQS